MEVFSRDILILKIIQRHKPLSKLRIYWSCRPCYVNMIFLHYWLILKSRTEKLKTDYNILEPPQIVCLILWNVWVTHHHHGAWQWGHWTEARCWWDVVIACWQNDPVCPVMVTRPTVSHLVPQTDPSVKLYNHGEGPLGVESGCYRFHI